MRRSMSSLWWRDSNQTASGNPGAVQSAGAALYTFRQPGLYAYVNHNLIEAIALGAAAHVQVEGQWNNDLMTQVVAPTALS